METKLFGNTLCLWTLRFVKIDYLPLLMLSFVVAPNTNWMSFFVLSTFDVKDLIALPINELVILISENLEPS